MSDEARKGRQVILIVIAALLLPSLVTPLTAGVSLGAVIARFGISAVMCVLMWRGYSWARSYLAFGLGLAALLAVLAGAFGLIAVLAGALAPLVVLRLAVTLLLAPLYAWAAWALWSSPKVEAYIEYRERQRNPDMSFNSGA